MSDTTPIEIVHEPGTTRGAFVGRIDGRELARMTYSVVNTGMVIIDHTEVDPSLGGKGVGRRLIDAAVAWGRSDGVRFLATCPFAKAQFDRDPSIRDVLG